MGLGFIPGERGNEGDAWRREITRRSSGSKKKTELNMLGLAGQKKPWGSAGRTLGRTPMSIYNSAGGVWVKEETDERAAGWDR